MKTYFINYVLLNVTAALVLGLGLSVVLGWYLQIPELIQILPLVDPMQFNTALGFVFSSLGILSLTNDHKKMTRYLSVFLLLLGGLTLIEYVFDLNLYIDELFVRRHATLAILYPGQMAPNAALGFSLCGIALLTMSTRKITSYYLLIGSICGALIAGFSLVAFLGYLSNIEPAYGWGKWTRMAIHTSYGLVIIGLMLILQARYISMKMRRKMPTLELPLTLNVLGLTITVALWQALQSTELYVSNQYDIKITNLVAESILIFGIVFSCVLSITAWFAIKFYKQVHALEHAQQKILVLNQKLKKLSYIDGLTDIPNRRLFDITLEKEIGRASRYQYSLALVLLDIDYFKDFNDFYGHQEGDHCLIQVAQKINDMARRHTDLAARYGGEEFALLLPNAGLEDAQKIAKRTLQAIADLQIPHQTSKVSSFVTLSAGISVCIPQQEITAQDLIYHSDQALYQAKKNGRNCTATVEF